MGLLRKLVKSFVIVSVSIFFLILLFFVRILVRPRVARRKIQLSVSRLCCWLGATILDYKVEVVGEAVDSSKNYLYVCNHMSYVDIFILSHITKACFVTSVEMRDTPVLGWIVKGAGCLFVERRSKHGLRAEIAEITQALEDGFNVFIFPEATSTNGDEILRFRRPLYAAALYAKKTIKPLVINYKSIDGVPVTKSNRDSICWYGGMSLAPHFLKMASQKNFLAEITILDEVVPEENEQSGDLALKTQQMVTENYRPFT